MQIQSRLDTWLREARRPCLSKAFGRHTIIRDPFRVQQTSLCIIIYWLYHPLVKVAPPFTVNSNVSAAVPVKAVVEQFRPVKSITLANELSYPVDLKDVR
jgi:hypothetical protein